jgi:adenosine deaminase
MNLSALPKIELHLHLDCSLSFDVVNELNPEITETEYRRLFKAPPKCDSLADYISRAQKSIELMQTQESIRMVVSDLFQQLKADNVIYTEIRFAPLEHIRGNLSPEEVVKTVSKRVEKEVNATGIEAGIILCTLRHYTEEQSLQTVELVKQFREKGVVGFDIAADEANYPVDNHISAFEFAHRNGINCTAHAGEARGPESMWDSIRYFNPDRIGHGVRSGEDRELLKFIRDNDIHLEVCPTSNIQTDVFDTISDHNIDDLYNFGLSVGINTDTRTISDVTLAHEYQIMADVFGWEKEQLLKCNLEAINHAFTTDSVKKRLRDKVLNGFEVRE